MRQGDKMKVPKPRKLPSGSWNITLRLGGQNISITANTEKQCTQRAQLIKAEYLSGRKIERNTQAENKTLGKLMDEYIADRAKVLSPSTINGYQCIRRTRFQTYIDKPFSSIGNWQRLINAEVADGVSGKTIKNSWGLLSACIAYSGLPVPDVKLPSVVQSSRPWLDAEQIRTFVKAVHGHPVEIPALLALHSLRRSEILGLTWDKIDLQSNTIRIEGSAVLNEENKLVSKETNKTKKSRRTIPIMIPELKDALLAVPEKKRVGKVYRKSPTLIWEQVNHVCEKNGLPQVGVHGLRHSFASLALSAEVGMTEREVMEIGGWESQQVVHGIYEHLSQRDRLKAENKLSAFFKKTCTDSCTDSKKFNE